jgi:hypothetical protein
MRCLAGVDGVEDEGSGVHMRQQRDCVERRAERTSIRRVDYDDELAARIAAMHFAARKREDVSFDFGEALGTRLHQDACDFAAGRRNHAIRGQHAARDQGATIDCLMLGQGSHS